jgi:hypothetical protein
MIDPDIRIAGFDAQSFRRLLALFTPDPNAAGAETTGGLLFVVENAHGEILFAHHSKRGRIERLPDVTDPAKLRRIYGARRCVVVREGALEELEQRTALRLSPKDDYLTQLLMVAHATREMIHAEQIRIDPDPFGSLPLPGPAMIGRALDVLLPPGRSAVLCSWDGASIDTAAAVHRGETGSIVSLIGPEWLERSVGPLGGDFRRDYRHITEAVSTSIAPVAIGIFAEARTLHALLRSPDPGAFAAAAATRDLVVHPMPPYAAVALGADALRSVAATSGRALGGVDLVTAFTPIARALLDAVDVHTVTSILGFNPLATLSQWLARRSEDRVGPPPMLTAPEDER